MKVFNELKKEINILINNNTLIDTNYLNLSNIGKFIMNLSNSNSMDKSSLFEYNDDFSLVFFAMPGCSSCHPEIEDLIDLNNRYGVVSVNIIIFEEYEGIDNFIKKYSGFFKIIIASHDVLIKDLSFPTIVLVDNRFNVINKHYSARSAYNSLKNTVFSKQRGEILLNK